MRKLIVILSFATLLTGCETMPQSQSQSLAVSYDPEVTTVTSNTDSEALMKRRVAELEAQLAEAKKVSMQEREAEAPEVGYYKVFQTLDDGHLQKAVTDRMLWFVLEKSYSFPNLWTECCTTTRWSGLTTRKSLMF